MTPPTPCPGPDELVIYREHELPERRAAEVRAHVAACSACATRLGELERLVADLRAPAIDLDPRAVARLMQRLDAPARVHRRMPWRIAAALAVAIGVAVALVIRPTGRGDTFAARGAADELVLGHVTADAIARDVGMTIYALGARGSGARPLATGARVSPGTAYVLGYRDLSRAVPLFALVFAVDTAGDVHWLYPGYQVAADDPAAVWLAPTDATRLAPEAVVLDRVPAGRLRVVAIITAEQLHVSAIERLHGAALGTDALRRRFPAAAVSDQSFEVTP